MSDHSPLFRPFSLGALQLRNRIVMAPMTRSASPGNRPNARNVAYYRRRAAGGTGLIITEGTCINHIAASGYPDVPYFYGEERLAGWRRVADDEFDLVAVGRAMIANPDWANKVRSDSGDIRAFQRDMLLDLE